MSLKMPDLDQAVLARRGEIAAALREIVAGEGSSITRTGCGLSESDGLTAYRQPPMAVVAGQRRRSRCPASRFRVPSRRPARAARTAPCCPCSNSPGSIGKHVTEPCPVTQSRLCLLAFGPMTGASVSVRPSGRASSTSTTHRRCRRVAADQIQLAPAMTPVLAKDPQKARGQQGGGPVLALAPPLAVVGRSGVDDDKPGHQRRWPAPGRARPKRDPEKRLVEAVNGNRSCRTADPAAARLGAAIQTATLQETSLGVLAEVGLEGIVRPENRRDRPVVQGLEHRLGRTELALPSSGEGLAQDASSRRCQR